MAAWERGVEVLKNVGCSGKIDLVFARGTDDLLSVDVAVLRSNGKGVFGVSGSIPYKIVTPVVVHPVTREIRWVKGREPKGWEDFWK